jgi:hypothetical protein
MAACVLGGVRLIESEVQRLRQRADQQRLGQTGHALQKCVTAGEDGHQHLLDDFVLADDHLGQLVADAVVGLLAALHRGDIVGGKGFGHGRLLCRWNFS